MNALVVATGMNSYFGKTAKLVEDVKTQSHIQQVIIKIGNYLIYLAIAMVSLIFVAAFIRGESFPETLKFALVLHHACHTHFRLLSGNSTYDCSVGTFK
ncbi:H+-transporting ATPase [Candidatus Methanophagaceae archaeon]|nr:H+-transporting ATPase [Methanophagales archaeon]